MKKIRLNQHGASLSETLVTVLLLVIVLSAVTAGVHAMSDSYFKIRKRADAESLLMTASDVISGDLKNVTSVEKNAFYCESRYSYIQYFNSDKGVQVRYLGYPDNGTSETLTEQSEKPLVTDKTNSDQLYTRLSDDGVQWENGYFEYTLDVYSTEDRNTPIASQKIDVRPLNTVSTSTSQQSEDTD